MSIIREEWNNLNKIWYANTPIVQIVWRNMLHSSKQMCNSLCNWKFSTSVVIIYLYKSIGSLMIICRCRKSLYWSTPSKYTGPRTKGIKYKDKPVVDFGGGGFGSVDFNFRGAHIHSWVFVIRSDIILLWCSLNGGSYTDETNVMK